MQRAAGIVLAGAALVLIALLFDTAPLFVPGVAFVVIGIVVPVWVTLSARGASVERRLESDRVIEGEPFEASFRVRRSAIGLPGAVVLDSIVPAPVSLDGALSVIRGARATQIRVVTRFPRRGLRRLAPPRLLVSDALELASAVRAGHGPSQDVLVLPFTEPVRWASRDASSGERAQGRSQGEPLSAVDVDGLRPYRPGTPASRIHWPALARGAGLLERRLEADGEMRPLIVLDTRGGPEPDALDAAVRGAASLALELGRRGGCRVLLSGERRPLELDPDLLNWATVHARLALVQGGPRAPAPMLASGSRPGPLLYISALALERLPPGLVGVGSGARVLVLPKELSGRTAGAPTFEVAGCYGFVVRTHGSWKRVRAA